LRVYVRFWNNGNNACLIAGKAGEWRRFVELRSLHILAEKSGIWWLQMTYKFNIAYIEQLMLKNLTLLGQIL